MRTEKEIRDMIQTLEEIFPEGTELPVTGMLAPIYHYQLGTLAGLKSAVGDYPSFTEVNLEEFMKSIDNGGVRTK